MIGSGIFVANKSVLESTGSIGLCLILWIICGISALLGLNFKYRYKKNSYENHIQN